MNDELLEKIEALLRTNIENVSANHWIPAIHEDKIIGLAQELLALFNTNKPKNKVCPDCGDYGWVYDETGTVRSVCPCHY
jgi:hypothetical protein